MVWYLLGILEAFLAFRVVLKVLAANPSAGFTSFIYGFTRPFVTPFISVFNVSKVTQGSVMEWTTILAMLVYYLIAWAIIRLFVMGKPMSNVEASVKLDREEDN